jgi:hypothetical protein
MHNCLGSARNSSGKFNQFAIEMRTRFISIFRNVLLAVCIFALNVAAHSRVIAFGFLEMANGIL